MSHDHETLLQAVRANNYAQWLSNDDISAVLTLHYDIQEFRVVGHEQLLLSIVEIFQANAEPTLLPIVINKGGVHWTCIVLERCGGRFFAYHQDSQAKYLSQRLRRLLGLKDFTVFDACKEQQPSEDQDNCGIWVLLNIASILAMLQNQAPENRMTTASRAQRASKELSDALQVCNCNELNSYLGQFARLPRAMSSLTKPNQHHQLYIYLSEVELGRISETIWCLKFIMKSIFNDNLYRKRFIKWWLVNHRFIFIKPVYIIYYLPHMIEAYKHSEKNNSLPKASVNKSLLLHAAQFEKDLETFKLDKTNFEIECFFRMFFIGRPLQTSSLSRSNWNHLQLLPQRS
uniref:Ubiquitin-like protease family profile domain-containing protein n=1 Tax=Trichogramma kaykai TaxID=54128 RepID=A0ABD2VV10_9HYME